MYRRDLALIDGAGESLGLWFTRQEKGPRWTRQESLGPWFTRWETGPRWTRRWLGSRFG